MVAQFLGLKLRLLANLFRRSPWQVVGIVLGLIYGLGIALWLVVGLAALRFAPVDLARAAVVVAGSVIVLGFLVLPLLFGVDDVLDPRRFSLFGIPNRRLAGALAVSALVGVPSLVICVVAAAQIVTWSRGFAAVSFAVAAALLIVATCLLGARVTTSVAAFLLATRRARETTGLIALIAIVSVSPVVVLLTNVDWQRNGLAIVRSLAKVLGWTPLGAAWAAPADAAAGEFGGAFLKLLVACAFVGLLWLVWQALVAWMLTTGQREPGVRDYSGLGWFSRMPATPAGAIAARSITYWLRDARYRVALVIVPIVPTVMILILLVGGVPGRFLVLLPVPIMCFFLAWSTVHNDVAYDNSAIWLHVVASTPGWADRVGRLIPALALGILVIGVGAPVCAMIAGDWSMLPSLIGVSGCVLLCGLGLSSIMSVRFPYPTVRPGDSPFTQPQSSATAATWMQSLTVLAIIALVTPSVILAFLGLEFGALWHFASLGAGIVIGLAVLVIGIAWGGRMFESRGPELLAFALRN